MNNLSRLQESAAWNERSATYEQLAEPFTLRFGLALAEELGIRAGERVLDVAAGTGGLALTLARRGVDVTAVDHSSVMAERIARRAGAEGLEGRLTTAAMDGQALDLDDGCFDVALSVFGVMLFPDHEAGLRELIRVLHGGGRAGLAVWREFGAGPALLLHQSFTAVFPDREVPAMPAGLAAWSDPESLSQSMERAGLVDLRVRQMTQDWEFPSVEWVGENGERLFEMLPIWSAVDAGERRRLTDHMMSALAAKDRPAMPSPALLAVGTKPPRR